MESMPSSLPELSTTGRWRKWRSSIIARASPGRVARVASSTGVVINSRTGVTSGLRWARASLRSTSRSVKMPATNPAASTTPTAPTRRSSIRRIASATLASTWTAATSESQSSRMPICAPPRLARMVMSLASDQNPAVAEDLGIMTCGEPVSSVNRAHPGILFARKLVLEHAAVLHHKRHAAQSSDVTQGIAVDGDDIGVGAGRDLAHLSRQVKHLGSPGGGTLNSIDGRHAKLDHTGEFLSHRLRPGNAAHIGTEHDLHSGLHCLLQGRSVHGDAFSITLAIWRLRRGPVMIVGGKGGAVPRPLLHHLANLRVGDFQSVLEGMAAPDGGGVQAHAVVSVASHLPPPTVGFVHDGLQFLDRECWLRVQFTVLAYPRAMSHVNLDPIGPMIKLLASRLARLDRPVDDLRALGHVEFRSVVFQVIAAGGRDGAGHDNQSRPRNVALFDRHLDADVAVAGAFGFHVTQRGKTLLQRP